MVKFAFALLDLRRFILLAVLVSTVPIISAHGPHEVQAPISRFIVRPIVQSARVLSHQLVHGASALHDVGGQVQ